MRTIPTSTVIYFYVDETPPVFITVPPSRVISQSTTLSGGSVTDPRFISIDRVELSSDNGNTWATIAQQNPITPSVNTIFTGTYAPPSGLDYVSVPIQFRATDPVGNSAVTTTTVIVDNVPPNLLPPNFTIPPGSYLDTVQTLVMTWTQPTDGSGVVTVTASIDQISQTVPSAVQGGTSTSTLAEQQRPVVCPHQRGGLAGQPHDL